MDFESTISQQLYSYGVKLMTEPGTQADPSNNDVLSLDSLPDEILLLLFSYLSTTDILQLRRCSYRLYNICTDKTLWTKVNVVCDGRTPAHVHILPFLHSKTVSLKFHKNAPSNDDEAHIDSCLGNHVFNQLGTLISLKKFDVTNHNIDKEILSLRYLPATITELKLPGTKLIDSTDFLENIGEILPNLEVLDVSYCQWFVPQFLISLAECRNLKVLLMAGCRNIKNLNQYSWTAAPYTCRKLETLDMTFTGVIDRDMFWFPRIKLLKHIYLERPEDIQDSIDFITDKCIPCFGLYSREITDECIIISINRNDILGFFSNRNVETLVIRNFPGITDLTLEYVEKYFLALKYLDLSGSSCTFQQVSKFRFSRPEVFCIV